MAVPHSMRHQFERVLIPAGAKLVQESCRKCGQKRIRYANGNATYLNAKGSRSSFGRRPCVPVATADIPTESQLVEPPCGSDGFAELNKIVARIDRMAAAHHLSKRMTQEDAIVKDAFMIIRLMYEDMINHNVATKSREMAGRFLYSQRYEEVVKAIECKSTFS